MKLGVDIGISCSLVPVDEGLLKDVLPDAPKLIRKAALVKKPGQHRGEIKTARLKRRRQIPPSALSAANVTIMKTENSCR